MPYVKVTSQSTKDRILIAGAPNTGKTYSLATFIYGLHAFDPEREHEALAYAGDRQMVILSCPGEKGLKSLPTGEHITCFAPDTNKYESSAHVIKDFEECVYMLLAKKEVDILALDGIHSLYAYYMDKLTGGKYLKGEDFDSRIFGQGHNVFGQFLSQIYHSSIPTVVCTTWEDWESKDDNPNIKDALKTKALYPSLPGKMAKAICGHFDATLSARLAPHCLGGAISRLKDPYKSSCPYDGVRRSDAKDAAVVGSDHHVWQFLPLGDVRGVGIKGLKKVNDVMRDTPYIHQNYEVLKTFMKRYA